MKRQLSVVAAIVMTIFSSQALAQKGNVQTVFKPGIHSSGGYGALVNKFTTIRGKFANISGIYGGWYINHRFMIGAGLESVTNNLRVPQSFSADPGRDLSYEYGQFGLVTEYVPASDKPIHPVFQLFSGAGFTLQYQRYGWHDSYSHPEVHDENWFVVVEPTVQIEINLLKWMRFSPGVSYRATFGSDGKGLADKDMRNFSYSASLKFGKF